ncbi:hypothetical protein LF1_10690 [Rubripirellula obstinata]|uniref:Uncharacterized protein n=1 Tax=Rubripirellula obstinata TaxID=406547 RepID=A0A5B1CFP8_9BACT|nr:nucleotidyl transferase AbiEii/AbiGii toxin family protein [Rubripirellula obstinata]KAA1258549.1 hypothetical protein LF1_10690 [Rubripirellula obstinata]
MFPVEIFQTTLAKLTVILRELGIPFHLTGGLTGTVYGEPRMTQDIDVVIGPEQSRRQLDAFVKCISESDFMFDETSMRRAVKSGGLFQLLDQEECLKLDIYPREMIPGELGRSEMLEIFAGEVLPVVSRTDAAASKLVWISKGSHKSRRDLKAIFRTCSDEQKLSIRKQAEAFDLAELLNEVLAESYEIE